MRLTRYLKSSAAPSFLAELNITAGKNLGVFDGAWRAGGGPSVYSVNPSTGETIAEISSGTVEDYNRVADAAKTAEKEWRSMPVPARGDIVRQVGEALRAKLEPLGKLVSLEVGKSLPEGIGEVQEYVDICEFAVGLSRTINGQVLPSERQDHVLLETWNPVGTLGIISAFNFPCAVFGWNSALNMIAGNSAVWKGAPSTPLTTIAVTKILQGVLEKNGINGAIAGALVAGADVGAEMAADPRMDIVSFTGSTNIGRSVGVAVQQRFGKAILELGGNNALIIHEDADVDMAVRSAFFGAVGTAGQRCTSTRRLLIHSSLYDKVVSQLTAAYSKVTVGNPLDEGVLMGPLHSAAAADAFKKGVARAVGEGGTVLAGGKRIPGKGNFVEPTVIAIPNGDAQCVQDELFAPILYVLKYDTLEEAIEINNSVKQGLSSSLFTKSQQNVFKWIGPNGSDCGLANINQSTSGAEIGGAFGGEKETGGGRESGSDAWRQYMRRATCTINYGDEVPLSQGIKFE